MKKDEFMNTNVIVPITFDEVEAEINKLEGEDKLYFDALEIERKFILNLIEVRKEMGLTQSELAKKTGLSQQVVSSIEKCGRRPTLLNLVRYTVGLGLDLNQIFN